MFVGTIYSFVPVALGDVITSAVNNNQSRKLAGKTSPNPAVASAAARSSLRGRLERAGESDRQMCHQVNLSESSSHHSRAHCPPPTPPVPSFCCPRCRCLFLPLCSFPSQHLSSLYPLPTVSSFFNASLPLLLREATALVSPTFRY